MLEVTYHVEMCGVFEGATCCLWAFTPVQSSKPVMQVRVVDSDHFHIAFEECVICDIESDDGWVQANIGFGDV